MKPPLHWTFAYTTVEPGKVVDHTLRIRVSGWLPFAFVRHTKVQRPEPPQATDALDLGGQLDRPLACLSLVDPWLAREERALRELAARPPVKERP